MGQNLELFGFEYARYPNADTESADSLQANFTEYEVSLLFPALRKEKFSLLAGGTYRLVIPEGADRTYESNLFFLAAKLIGAYSLSGREKLILTSIPAISTTTDSPEFTADNILIQGALLYQKEVNNQFSYTVGVLSTSRFGSPLIIPSLGLSHKGEKIRLDMNLPFLISTRWNYENDFSYGLKLSVNGSQYNFEDTSFDGAEVDVANFSRIRFGPQIQYRVKGPLVLNVFGGLAANRTYEFERVGADNIDFSLENGPFISFRLSLKPQPKNK